MNLHCNLMPIIRNEKTLIKNPTFSVHQNEICALVAANGSGKSSLFQDIFFKQHPRQGLVINTPTQTIDLSQSECSERSLNGLFLSLQTPPEIDGIKMNTFLLTMINTHKMFNNQDTLKMSDLKTQIAHFETFFPNSITLMSRNTLNVGFSGGEKKRSELLQLFLLKPKFIFFDEIDTGLDQQSLIYLSQFIKHILPTCGIFIISHRLDFLNMLPISKLFSIHNQTLIEIPHNNKLIQDTLQNYEHS